MHEILAKIEGGEKYGEKEQEEEIQEKKERIEGKVIRMGQNFHGGDSKKANSRSKIGLPEVRGKPQAYCEIYLRCTKENERNPKLREKEKEGERES